MSRVAETVEIPAVDPNADYYARIATSTDFTALRRRFLRFVVPMTATYMGWYLLFVLLAMYAPGVMAIKVAGDLTFGLVMGGLQFLSTFALAAWYVRFANPTLVPAAAASRDGGAGGRLEGRRQAGRPRLWEPPDPGVSPIRDRVDGGIV